MSYEPFCSTEIIFLSKLEMETALCKLKDNHIIIVMTSSGMKRWKLKSTLDTLMFQNKVVWIDKVNPNPTPRDIYDAIQQISFEKVDIILAIGGGSAMDLGKGISACYSLKSKDMTEDLILDTIKRKDYLFQQNWIDILAIPTTAGTGSELTKWATIWDRKNHVKYSVEAEGLLPKKAMIVPELTLLLGTELTLSTGLDALCHGIEAYWSIYTNDLVQEIAYRSIEINLQTLKQVLVTPDDICLRTDMCRASVLAGIAFSHTRTTACHSISYPLTMYYDIPHGYASALTLKEVSDRNRGNFKNSTRLFSLFNAYGGLGNWLESVTEGIVDLKLSQFGVCFQEIQEITNHSFTVGRMENNPVCFSKEDVSEILSEIF